MQKFSVTDARTDGQMKSYMMIATCISNLAERKMSLGLSLCTHVVHIQTHAYRHDACIMYYLRIGLSVFIFKMAVNIVMYKISHVQCFRSNGVLIELNTRIWCAIILCWRSTRTSTCWSPYEAKGWTPENVNYAEQSWSSMHFYSIYESYSYLAMYVHKILVLQTQKEGYTAEPL